MVCKKIIQIMLLLGATTQVQAETNRENLADFTYYTSQVLTFVDFAMTRDCLDRDDCEEVNKVTKKLIAGSHSEEKLIAVMFAVMGINHWVQSQLPTNARILYNTTQTYLRYDAIKNHVELGLEVKF